MERKSYTSVFALFCVISFSAVLITALFTDLLETKEALQNSQYEINKISEEISSSENRIELKENEIANLNNKYAQLQESYNTIQNESSLLLETITERERLLSRAELLKYEDTNTFLESDVFEKVVYLTFDDGPSDRTLRILDILDEHNVKATFFVNYHEEAEKLGIYKMIVERGHSIGNHTYDHEYPCEDWQTFLESLFKMEDFIFEQTGVRPRIIRFPGGSSGSWKHSSEYIKNVGLLNEMGYIYFDWNLTNHDADSRFSGIDEEKMIELIRIESAGRDKIMLLMHDSGGKYTTVQALDEIIEYYKERNYVFLPVTPYSYNPQYFSAKQDDTIDISN